MLQTEHIKLKKVVGKGNIKERTEHHSFAVSGKELIQFNSILLLTRPYRKTKFESQDKRSVLKR